MSRAAIGILALMMLALLAPAAQAQWRNDDAAPIDDRRSDTYTSEEMLEVGHRFFGTTTRGLAELVERSFRSYGQPNGYILGEEGSGAIIAGARYGEGILYTRNVGSRRVYWQGPSLGWDIGGNGARTMILAYNLPSVDYLYSRFLGLNGSAYVVGGLGMTAMMKDYTVLVPITTGVGARIGVNIGYLKFTRRPTWNPF